MVGPGHGREHCRCGFQSFFQRLQRSWAYVRRVICASVGAEFGVGVGVGLGVGVWFILVSERVRHAASRGCGAASRQLRLQLDFRDCKLYVVAWCARNWHATGAHAGRARRRERDRAQATTGARVERACKHQRARAAALRAWSWRASINGRARDARKRGRESRSPISIQVQVEVLRRCARRGGSRSSRCTLHQRQEQRGRTTTATCYVVILSQARGEGLRRGMICVLVSGYRAVVWAGWLPTNTVYCPLAHPKPMPC
jgi:hypothetical protein